MKICRLLVFPLFVLVFSTGFSQDAKKITGILNECKCKEIVMITRGVEKTYTATWLEGIEEEDEFIVFSKGENKHRWNTKQITFIEKGNGFIRIYLN